jgi:hypothetical protein
MKSISFPLEIIDGDLSVDQDATEIIQSEILSILQTRKHERVFRQSYGTPNFLLRKLDINYLLIEINAALQISLVGLGFAQVVVEVDSDISELQQGLVNLVISYKVGDSLLKSNFLVDLNVGV